MESGRVNGSDDVIATLSSRVSELSKRVALLQAELEAAQKRVAVYEEHDATIQDAISGALRAAYTIRERAETTAGQILEQAREERRLLLKEIERLREERDSLENEIATHRRSGIAAVAPRPLSTESAAAELRAVASEALRGLFQEIVDDMRAAPRASAPSTPMPAAPQRPTAAAPPTAEAAAPAAPSPAPAPDPTYEYMAKVKRGSLADEIEQEEIAPEPATQEPAATPEPAATAPAPAPERPLAPPPLEVVPRSETEEIARPRVEAAVATSDIQLVLSPVASFPRLVEIERHIQALPVVRTLYVRDFRAGTATLAVALRSAMTPEEFGGMLSGLERPRMRIVSGSRNTIELRIEGEAGVA